MAILSDNVLMSALAKGHTWPMRLLIKRYGNMVYRLVNRLLTDSGEGEDVAQEVFIRVWRKASDYDGRYSLSTWIYHITYNLSVDRLRAMKRKADFECGYETSYEGIEKFSDPLEAEDFNKLFKTVLSKLSPAQRTVFCLAELEGLSHDEISEITGMGYDSIKSNLYFARRNIREMLKGR